jgi:hypothetical protein
LKNDNEGIVLRPFSTLACFTCTKEGIYDGVALAQVGLGSIPVRSPRGKSWERKRCERFETTSLADTGQNKVDNSQPPWHVDSRYAATLHGC